MNRTPEVEAMSNLITDKILEGASIEEIALLVDESMKIMDEARINQ